MILGFTPVASEAHENTNGGRVAAATNVRLTVEGLDDEVEEGGIFSKLRKWLGIRRPSVVKPAIGKTFTVQASAYASSPYQTNSQPCITAAGTRVRYGVVATNFLPMGTLLDINGEPFIVEDRMNSRYKGYYMDLWFPSTSKALEFGRKNLKITITGYGEPGQPLYTPTPTPIPEITSTPTPQETSGTTEGELVVLVQEEESTWDIFRSWTSLVTLTFSQLIGARVNPSVNQHDVDCSK